MSELKPFGILAPSAGIRQDVPSILLSEAYTSESEDVVFKDGEIELAKKRLKRFDDALPHAILTQHIYKKPSIGLELSIYLTKRDICYRDKDNDRFVFINKIYNEGSIDAFTELSASFQLQFDLPSGEDLEAEVKAGDYIQIDDNTSYHTGVTWYAIESVEELSAGTFAVTCAGSLPSGFSIPSGGQDYTIRITYSGDDTDRWSIDTFNEEMIGTNNGNDALFIWTGSGQVTDLSCSIDGTNIKCKRVFHFDNRFLYGWPIIDGVEYPFRIIYTGLGDKSDLGDDSGSDAGYITVDEGTGTFQGFSNDAGFLTLWKTDAIISAWSSGDSLIIRKRLVVDGVGTQAPDSLVTTDRGTFFYSKDDTIRLYTGTSWGIVSDRIKKTVSNINSDYTYAIQGTWLKGPRHVAWAIPYYDSTTLNRVLVYNLSEPGNHWIELDMPVCSWGQDSLAANLTWDALKYTTWDSWSWSVWNTREALSGNPLDIVGGYDGYIYEMYGEYLDNGDSYTGYAVIETDLSKDKKKLFMYKRVLQADIYLRKESSGELAFEYKADNEPNWNSLGSVLLTGTEDILIKDLPMDIRGRSFKIRPKGTTKFSWLGVVLWFFEDGIR